MKTQAEFKTSIHQDNTYTAEPLIYKLRRMTETNEPIKAETTIVYTEKAQGVMPAYDIRADKFDIAMEAQDKYQASLEARGEGRGDDVMRQENETKKGRYEGIGEKKAEPSGGLTE